MGSPESVAAIASLVPTARSELVIPARIDARLNFDYVPRHPRIAGLYEQAKTAQWNATTDIDWTIDRRFGDPLPEESAYAMNAFLRSRLARYGVKFWDDFRWELQAWLVSQFLHGEQGALLATSRLTEEVPGIEAKYYAASQVADEARHTEVFARYLREHIPAPYAISAPLGTLVENILADSRWDITALGMQLIIEPLGLAAFRLANSTLHDRLIRQITHMVARDEARHVSYGIFLLSGVVRELTEAERREREDFVIEAASLMSQRFLLEDIWDRLGVPRAMGVQFAAESPMMVTYRQTVFMKVVSSLSRVQLMTPRVRRAMDQLNLLGAGRRG